ncbi:SDR family oxidoreductase [Alicyclobacillus fastidiosus]|uniref:SDR family oxidoreductase n=1 Tax=Alicyclobacillus fastidiosus TaxID=392011 RepID=A0ABY6ZGR7_9BACL|nr:SDR family oxidoreductase [Alicyclobacillus fastidiosus]WAH41692.1 SDR family oxidoreductase [Alicyclobacillus fastidiosus]GMA63371.1 NAD(P)-dependent oxidoreductase [Alicyclobacillus fastidiosus]
MAESSKSSGSAGTAVQTTPYPTSFPPQHQAEQPGLERLMTPTPVSDNLAYRGSGKLANKVAVITGGDSGIGRAVAIAFAKEGADVAVVYYNEHEDAQGTAKSVSQYGRQCVTLPVDVRDPATCKKAIQDVMKQFGKVDVLINNAAEQQPKNSILDITPEQLERTFRTNVFGYVYMIQAALPQMKPGATIVNTTSITAYEGNETLIDYSATKGAIVTLTRSLSTSLVKQGIRVNAVAPGPIWTPLIPSTFDAQKVSEFGSTTPMQRAGQPCELAPAYVYLASMDSSYVSGQVLHVNGGTIING